jgi:hypothetical protein
VQEALPVLAEMIGIQTGEAVPHQLELRQDTVRR